MIDLIVMRALDEVEAIEAVSLSWGIVDTKISQDELDVIILEARRWAQEQTGDFSSLTRDVILGELRNRGLVRLFGSGPNIPISKNYYRSRMAETVRLIFKLRQLFPRHANGSDWQLAPRLVSDFRFARRVRQTPKREKKVDELIAEVADLNLCSNERDAVEYLINSYGGSGFEFSNFQLKALITILRGFEVDSSGSRIKKGDYGAIITAGTGSGKTLAFYMPVLAKIAANICELSGVRQNWLQCLAIYPRVELQRDQFASILKESSRLDGFLESKGHRKIRLGILYGDTPSSTHYIKESWKQGNGGYVCPYFKCLEGCGSKYLWSNEDIKLNKERLVCVGCGHKIAGERLCLTRRSIQRNPPDILFTSAEMLNRNLSNNEYRYAFGFGAAPHKPEFLLVDEVHVYSGSYGAQFGFLLRRWRNMVSANRFRSNPVVVGLSATLVDAERFFEDLTGLFPGSVRLVKPLLSEMDLHGAEYFLAIKGDPISRTALLSTTIQTNMLLSRMLDNRDSPISKGLYGQKLFAFTDDIDVTNRLYWNTRDTEEPSPLAMLRDPDLSQARIQDGQDWEFPHFINGLNISSKSTGRVSSQDPGLDQNNEIVIATASLEVGVDDPNVGAVVQHKNPRNFASFMQRKGRAGRSKIMRPWTAIVLSDYGRDRLAYQGYEHIFDPELKVEPLPLESFHIKKIQATLFLLDYISTELNFHEKVKGKSTSNRNVWNLLSKLSKPGSEKRTYQLILLEILEGILGDTYSHNQFKKGLSRVLKLTADETDVVLWDQPRPIMTAVLPTIIRKIKFDLVDDVQGDEIKDIRTEGGPKDINPLPQFIPSALFSDLNLPELTIVIPEANNQYDKMPIMRGLKTFSPGRLSKRYNIDYKQERHWLPIENYENGLSNVKINDGKFASRYEGEWMGQSGEKVRAFRPLEIKLEKPPKEVQDTSNSFPNWESQFCTNKDPIKITISKTLGTVATVFESLKIYTHGSSCPLTVRRFFRNADATIKLRNGDEFRTNVTFSDDKGPVAIGYETDVDAMSFSLCLNDLIDKFLSSEDLEIQKVIRTERYFDEIRKSELLNHISNPFLREWIGSIYFETLSLLAITNNSDLFTAANIVLDRDAPYDFEDVLKKLFQSGDFKALSEDENQESDVLADTGKSEKLRKEILSNISSDETLSALRIISKIFSAPMITIVERWLEDIAANTMAKVLTTVVQRLVPNMDHGEIVVDLKKGPETLEVDSLNYEIIISEISPGGLGIIEKISEEYALDPRRFYQIALSEIEANEHELNDFQLSKLIVDAIKEDTDTAINFASFRRASNSVKNQEVRKELISSIQKSDYALFHSFSTTLFSRILRPGTSKETDFLYADILEFWNLHSNRLKIEIDSRVISFAYSVLKGGSVDGLIAGLDLYPPEENQDVWRSNVINGLLWSRGRLIRNQHLQHYNPFEANSLVERLTLMPLFDIGEEEIELGALEWKEKFQSMISVNGIIKVTCPGENKKLISEFLNFISIEPIFSKYLSSFARVTSIKRNQDTWEMYCELPEIMQ